MNRRAKRSGLVLSGVLLLGAVGPAVVGGVPVEAQRWHDGYRRSPRYDDRRYDDRHHGGIGPGKGALIGGGAGAVLGALVGGGAKGALIGGAVGAGGGALLGKVNADNRHERDWRDGRRY